jgi:hypothetical protein
MGDVPFPADDPCVNGRTSTASERDRFSSFLSHVDSLSHDRGNSLKFLSDFSHDPPSKDDHWLQKLARVIKKSHADHRRALRLEGDCVFLSVRKRGDFGSRGV